jgi:DNA-binding CsgD family transcriptional regulator
MMTERDVLEQLQSLTERQREVLKLVCEGLPYKDVGKELFITEGAVKAHMANIYEKLGLIYITGTLRSKALFETYCPALKSGVFETTSDEPVEPEPAPEEVIKIVEQDERALVIVEPDVIEMIPPEQPKKKRRRRNRWKWILVVVLLGLVTFGGFKLYEWGRDFLLNFQNQPIQEQADIDDIVQQTYHAQPTIQPTKIPTKEAVIVPTNTELPPKPVPTRTPASIITLPFEDDFSQGFNSVWDLQFADWMVKNGKASIIETENLATGWAIINDPTLNNYRLKVHIDVPHMYSAAQGEMFIMVRYDQNREKQLLLKFNSLSKVHWAQLTRGMQGYVEAIDDPSKFYYPSSADVVIEVNGNNFTAWVGGQMVGNISLSGYENGGIALGIFCTYYDCPQYSNFSLEPIN